MISLKTLRMIQVLFDEWIIQHRCLKKKLFYLVILVNQDIKI